MDKKQLENAVIDAIKTVYDPEIPVDIFELGLIYEIKIDDAFNVHILMTLTSPSCPAAESIPDEVKQKNWRCRTRKRGFGRNYLRPTLG